MSTQPDLKSHPSSAPWIWLVPAATAVFAMLGLPVEFSMLVRVVICGFAIWLALREYRVDDRLNTWFIWFGLAAIAFNPILPIHPGRGAWVVLDLLVAGLFLTHFVKHGRT